MAELAQLEQPDYARDAAASANKEYFKWKGNRGKGSFDPTPLLKQREGGDRPDVYLDSEDKLTAGTGHLLTEAELKKYKEGDIIPQQVRDKWFEEDTQKSINAAMYQAKEIGVSNPQFIENLTSVNFQLGTSWNKEHKKTWAFMKEGQWEKAAVESADSDWNSQSRNRVQDFQLALRSL